MVAFGAHADNSKQRTLNVSFTPATVVVTSEERSHQFVLFAIGIGSHGRAALLTREVLTETDTDGDGVITFTPRRIPRRSVWVAVDVENGAYGIASPSGELPSPLPVGDEAWRGGRTDLEVARRYLEVLLVRPRVGAWTKRATDGGPQDDDGRYNGTSRLRLEKMDRLLGDSGGPPFAAPKDLLVVVDPQSLQYFVREAR